MKDGTKVKGQIKSYLAWPLLLSIIVIAGNIAIVFSNPVSAVILLPFSMSYVLIAGGLYYYRKRLLTKGLIEFAIEYAQIQKKLLDNVEIPYALVDESGQVIWNNKELSKLLGKNKIVKGSLTGWFPEIKKEVLPFNGEKSQIE